MHKVYIRSCITKKYLNPTYSKDRWVDFTNATYYLVEKIKGLEPLDLVDPALFTDDIVELLYFQDKKEIIISKEQSELIVDKRRIKKEFNSFNYKKMEHYIIFNFVMGNDPYYGINIGKNHKFNLFLNKINFLKEMIDNYHVTYKYLKLPFPSINKKDFHNQLKKLKDSI